MPEPNMRLPPNSDVRDVRNGQVWCETCKKYHGMNDNSCKRADDNVKNPNLTIY